MTDPYQSLGCEPLCESELLSACDLSLGYELSLGRELLPLAASKPARHCVVSDAHGAYVRSAL